MCHRPIASHSGSGSDPLLLQRHPLPPLGVAQQQHHPALPVPLQEIDFFGEIAGIAFSPEADSLFVGVSDLTYASMIQYERVTTDHEQVGGSRLKRGGGLEPPPRRAGEVGDALHGRAAPRAHLIWGSPSSPPLPHSCISVLQ